MLITRLLVAGLLLVASSAVALAQPPPQTPPPNTTDDPFPTPIPTTDGVITVGFREFASIPDVDGKPARTMAMVDEPGTKRLFVADMTGIIYTVSYDGHTVAPYLDLRDPKWAVSVQSQFSERGIQSIAFHPHFTRRGAPGFGKFYVLVDTSNTTPTPDFRPSAEAKRTHDNLLLEWTVKNPSAAAYDGDAPRELMRVEHPFPNHNGGHMTFNPLATARDADYGLLYVGMADGGSGGDPMDMSQNLASIFGKILRIDPLGKNSANGKYGIPAANPFASDGKDDTLAEIYAYGVRNPQRLFWDSKTGRMYMSDIGQNIVEEISPVTAGANLGWNDWEGSYAYVDRFVSTATKPRSDPKMTYPVVEYGQLDPLFQRNAAAIGGFVYRQNTIKQLAGLLIFGDNPSGEVFYVNADKLPPNGGQDAVRRILFDDEGESKTLLQLIRDKNMEQGKEIATRADLRFGVGPNGQIFILNKGDGLIRLIVPNTPRRTSKQ